MSHLNISTSFMEPMLPPEGQRDLEDAAFDLIAKASALAGQMNPLVVEGIGDLVRSMNCYYSNLIEDHNTHPRDIDRALRHEYATEPRRRALQLEAVAHIEVQRAIDEGHDDQLFPASTDYVLWLHKQFYSHLPEELLWVEDTESTDRCLVEPGQLRQRDVVVGRHLPPEPQYLAQFLKRFEQAYSPANLSKISQIVAIAASHHRFLWIHPFMDGNGRVARLMSHAMLKRLGVGSSLWSVARGLARQADRYKSLLMAADVTRQGDLDGRGNLSQKALTEFCLFFLRTCGDQVGYMQSILEPAELMRRMEAYTEDAIRAGRLPKNSFPLLREALLAGEFDRGRASALTGYKERMARNVLAQLLSAGLLTSSGSKAPVRLGFPISVIERWFPALYPSSVY